ncbi:MAG TPA: LON peptidase substrate-binding domain-containing protein [Thermoanaerobaculia bacterium]|nr:LON peptidase substrate-binding domain-containing protein [Thermoanaerobaculia bacterium]
MPAPSLPAVLPVFPLTGSLLLPGNYLPLNVFEPRYRNMVADALDGERTIGMIQPRRADPDDDWGLAEEPASPELYGVGCAGRIDRCEPQPDGRYLIVLRGVARFRAGCELPLQRGYRRVRADYAEFAGDLDESERELDPSPVLAAVRAFSRAHGLELDFTLLSGLSGITLLNGLAAALPFGPAEKQALLEAARPEERRGLLLSLLEMGVPRGPRERYVPPTVH